METHHGHDFYDLQDIFTYYVKFTSWKQTPSESIEKPIVLSLAGPELTGEVLDLGCGFGSLAKELLQRGATNYTGVDASRKMIAFGRALLSDERATFIQDNITHWEYPNTRYDLVVSCSVFHYIEDLDALLSKINQSLKPGGQLILSVEHPLFTFFNNSQAILSYNEYTDKHLWETNDYFDEGPRIHAWMKARVVKFHRSIEEYWRAITGAGFRIESLKEGRPTDLTATFQAIGMGKISVREPQFLILKAVKAFD